MSDCMKCGQPSHEHKDGVPPICPTTDRSKALEPTDAQVREAMQTAWDDFCDDARAIPGDIYRQGRKTFFRAGTWADHTAMHLRVIMRRATPPTEASDPDTIGSHIGNGGSFDPEVETEPSIWPLGHGVVMCAACADYLQNNSRTVRRYEAGDRAIPGPVERLMSMLPIERGEHRRGE